MILMILSIVWLSAGVVFTLNDFFIAETGMDPEYGFVFIITGVVLGIYSLIVGSEQ